MGGVAVSCPHRAALRSSALFPDVVNCMQTDNLELKKLVYLYLMNYAKSQPDMAIMAVNTFVKVRGQGTPRAGSPRQAAAQGAWAAFQRLSLLEEGLSKL